MDCAVMDRAQVRAVLVDGTGGPVVAPMLERHAARLEQLPAGATARDAEALARALRTVQQLYELSALTVGDGGDALVRAARAVGPDPHAVLAAPAVSVVADALGRLRTVLGAGVALVVVLPAPGRLVDECGLAPAAAGAVLLEALRSFGEQEPDAFILTGHDDEPDPAHDALGAFYGAPVLRVGRRGTPRVAVWADLCPPEGAAPQAFLVTTPTEIRPELEPSEVRAGLTAAHRR